MEAGEASKVVALMDAGVPLVESQKDLTPYQRMVLLKELERQEAQRPSQPGGAASPGQMNQLRQPRGGGGETVTYTNDGS